MITKRLEHSTCCCYVAAIKYLQRKENFEKWKDLSEFIFGVGMYFCIKRGLFSMDEYAMEQNKTLNVW